jgi:hypothetical protein
VSENAFPIKGPISKKNIFFLMLTGIERLSFRQEQHANKNDYGAVVG